MQSSGQSLFSLLPRSFEATIRDDNPWWRGDPLTGLPALRRWVFPSIRSGLDNGLTPIQVLRGPRQVGKTTLLNQVISDLLASGVEATCILRVQFDEPPELRKIESPVLELARWFS